MFRCCFHVSHFSSLNAWHGSASSGLLFSPLQELTNFALSTAESVTLGRNQMGSTLLYTGAYIDKIGGKRSYIYYVAVFC